MNIWKQIGTSDQFDPSLQRDWKALLFWALVAYAVNVGTRLIDMGNWSYSALWVNGAPILATHDSYFWLAAAQGTAKAPLTFMPQFTREAASLFGLSLAQWAFYAPAFLASLVSPVVLLWGWLLGGRNAGIAAGLAGSLGLGFILRTRMGYYDTDIFTLIFPLLTAWFLAMMLRGRLRRGWLFGRPEQEEGEPSSSLRSLLVMAFCFGLAARMGTWWHADIITLQKIIIWGAVGMALLLGRKGYRGELLLALAVFGLAVLFGGTELEILDDFLGLSLADFKLYGWLGALVAALITAPVVLLAPRLSGSKRSLAAGGLLLALMVLLTNQFLPLLVALNKLAFYLKPEADPAAAVTVASGKTVAGPSYPAIAQSIIEAKAVDVWGVLRRLSPLGWFSILGLLGYVWVLLRRPLAVLLLPLLGLGLAGIVLGTRFAMFGGPAVLLGAGVSLSWLTHWYAGRKRELNWLTPLSQVVVGLALAGAMAWQISGLAPTPVIDRSHAEALMALKDELPEDAMIWTWWDWGYATQFYSGRMTPIDGGKHAGRDIYPTAVALSTSSLSQANNMIRYAAAQGYEPAKVWDALPAEEAARLVDSLRNDTLATPDIPPQYLVVSWGNLNIQGWITFYGNWDLAKGEGGKGNSKHLTENFRFDAKHGAAVFQNGRVAVVSSVDSIEKNRTNHLDIWMNTGPHLVIKRGDIPDAYFLDDTVYNSAMVQLLMAKPRELSPYFELVYDGSPEVRVFRVVGS